MCFVESMAWVWVEALFIYREPLMKESVIKDQPNITDTAVCRYIVQLGFVWAALNCSPVEDQQSPTLQGAASGTTAAAPAPAAAAARFVPGSAGSSYSPAPPRVNSHWHNLTTDTAWKSSSAEQYPA